MKQPASWVGIDQLLPPPNSVSDIPDGFFAALAEQLEAAVSSASPKALVEAERDLLGLLRRLIQAAPVEVGDAILGNEGARTPWRDAYLLGQLAFAQLFAGQSAGSRADDEFSDVLFQNGNAPYIEALAEGDLRNTDLARLLGNVPEETVSRKLKRLRELGITDFRRRGRDVLNFLTPAARVLVEERARLQPVARIAQPAPTPRPVSRVLTREVDRLDTHMKTQMNFSEQSEMEESF